MMSALYTGASGVKTHNSGLNVVGNNLANVNTIAFKQQNFIFQDMLYEDLNLGTSSQVVSNQLGHGSMHFSARTLFEEGPYESTTNYTDLAIGGDGYFQVQADNGDLYLTRAGNFTFDKEGFLEDGNGSKLMGYPLNIETGEYSGELAPIQLDITDDQFISHARTTTSISASLNLGFESNAIANYQTVTIAAPTQSDPNATKEVQQEIDPYFSLLNNYDATLEDPLIGVPYSQPLTVYDAEGNKQELTVHFDMASEINGQKTMEYIITSDPSLDGRAGMLDADGLPTEKAGLLMSGTLTFSSSGQLIDMSAFTAEEGSDLSDLSNWTPSELDENGTPVINLNLAGIGTQSVSINLGGTATNGWTNADVTAADIANDNKLLPSLGLPPELIASATKAYDGASSLVEYSQDGYGEGKLSGIGFTEDGILYANFSNSQEHELFQIPIFRVTSEDGLRREGNNYYSPTAASGELEHGVATTENYGSVMGSYIEASNVDMAVEMTRLIVLQRGMQSNSKTIVTADEMLKKALELKRT